MKSFKQFLAEMARDNGKGHPNNFNQKDSWDSMKGTEFVTLIKKNIGSERYKLYKSPRGFYLTNEDDEYKGCLIQKNEDKKIFEIQTSNKTEDVKGFYRIMFTAILEDSDFKEIISDNELSSEAIKAYINLSKSSNLKIRLKLNGRFLDEEFNKENLIKNYSTVVSVMNKEG